MRGLRTQDAPSSEPQPSGGAGKEERRLRGAAGRHAAWEGHLGVQAGGGGDAPGALAACMAGMCLGLQGRWGRPLPAYWYSQLPPAPAHAQHVAPHPACLSLCTWRRAVLSAGLRSRHGPVSALRAEHPMDLPSWWGRPSLDPGLQGLLCVLAAVFPDDGLPGGAAGHLPVLCLRHRHRGRAGRRPPAPTGSLSERVQVGWAQ